MEDITDLVAELDLECKENDDFHKSITKKHDQDYNTLNNAISTVSDRLNVHINENTEARDLAQFKRFALEIIYPVGSVYISFTDQNPSTYLGGQWTKLGGRFLLAADGAHPVGSQGGEEKHTLTSAEMPAHTHTGTTGTAGSHTHAGSTGSAGSHSHTRGTMNITGRIGAISEEGVNYSSGAFYEDGAGGTGHGGGWDKFVYMDASRSWIGSTSVCSDHTHSLIVTSAGDHQHSVTVGSTGSGQAHNNMPPYMAVYMFRRTA